MIHLILDSTSGVSEDFLRQHPNVHMIPLTIEIGDEYVPENKATIKAVIDRSEATKKSVPTSQPSTGDFLKMFAEIPAEDPIIMLCICATISGTYNGALLAARQSGRKNITVVNTKTTAIGMIHLALDGLELIEKGASYEEVAKELLDASERTGLTVALDTLDYIQRGGRIGRAAGLIGSILKIKPVIYLDTNNEVNALAKVRTAKKANQTMLKYLEERAPFKRIGVVHIENEEGGKALHALVQEQYPDIEVTLTLATPVLSAYLGPGLTGVIFECAK